MSIVIWYDCVCTDMEIDMKWEWSNMSHLENSLDCLFPTVQKTSKHQHAPQPQDQSLDKTPTNKDSMLARLVEMGFGAKESLDALQSTNNNLESACAMLAQRSADYGSKAAPRSPALSKHKTPPTT